MRKTIKAKPVSSYSAASTNSIPDTYIPSSDAITYDSPTIDDVQKENDTRNQRVNQIIDQMNGLTVENDGSRLADFTPAPSGSGSGSSGSGGNMGTIQDRDVNANPYHRMNLKGAEEIEDTEQNPLHFPVPKIQAHNDLVYSPSYSNTKYSNYGVSYDPSNMVYGAAVNAAKQAGMSHAQFQSDPRVLDKINYMIRMLENQAVEKTANITEEFMLYTFLGIFVIFVLDSFVRVGKYVR